jgi:imidazolonepropionase
MPILKDIRQLAVCPSEGGQAEIGLIDDAALVWQGGRIVWVGKEEELPAEFASEQVFSAQQGLVIPGLIDCHTHLAFGGWRAAEFEMRILGKPYVEIAAAGGGIASTVRATREASEEELFLRCMQHLENIAELGVTTLECKSGYGLTVADELKLLRVYKRLQNAQPLGIVSTFLGAHTVPREYKDDRERYLELVVKEMIPEVASEGLAIFCDVFVEQGAFSVEEARQVLEAASASGMKAKLHVDQLSSGGGAELAASLGAVSADHLEFVSDNGVEAMKQSGAVAVTLPLASLYTFQKPLDARRFIDAGVPVAVATDFNPGTAPSFHLPMVMMLACTANRMTPAEAVKGATIYAAQAIALAGEIGSLEVGKQADFAILQAESIDQWLYHFTSNACVKTVKAGQVMYERH